MKKTYISPVSNVYVINTREGILDQGSKFTGSEGSGGVEKYDPTAPTENTDNEARQGSNDIWSNEW